MQMATWRRFAMLALFASSSLLLCQSAPIKTSTRHFVMRDPTSGELVFFHPDPVTGEPIFFGPAPNQNEDTGDVVPNTENRAPSDNEPSGDSGNVIGDPQSAAPRGTATESDNTSANDETRETQASVTDNGPRPVVPNSDASEGNTAAGDILLETPMNGAETSTGTAPVATDVTAANTGADFDAVSGSGTTETSVESSETPSGTEGPVEEVSAGIGAPVEEGSPFEPASPGNSGVVSDIVPGSETAAAPGERSDAIAGSTAGTEAASVGIGAEDPSTDAVSPENSGEVSDTSPGTETATAPGESSDAAEGSQVGTDQVPSESASSDAIGATMEPASTETARDVPDSVPEAQTATDPVESSDAAAGPEAETGVGPSGSAAPATEETSQEPASPQNSGGVADARSEENAPSGNTEAVVETGSGAEGEQIQTSGDSTGTGQVEEQDRPKEIEDPAMETVDDVPIAPFTTGTENTEDDVTEEDVTSADGEVSGSSSEEPFPSESEEPTPESTPEETKEPELVTNDVPLLEGTRGRRTIGALLAAVLGLGALLVGGIFFFAKWRANSADKKEGGGGGNAPIENGGLDIAEDGARTGEQDSLTAEIVENGQVTGIEATTTENAAAVEAPDDLQANSGSAITSDFSAERVSTEGTSSVLNVVERSRNVKPILVAGGQDAGASAQKSPATIEAALEETQEGGEQSTAPGSMSLIAEHVSEGSGEHLTEGEDKRSVSTGNLKTVLSLPELDEDDDSRGI